jgi:ornithine cyclodeaminase
MTKMFILTETELRELVPLSPDVVSCVEDGFRALATQPVAMPPILRLDIPQYRGEVDVKTAYVPGIDSFAIKISPGFFDNPALGLPSLNGLMVLLSAKTGLVEALLLDNGYLTQIRTAAAGAVAAQHLARRESGIVAVLGAGEQAKLQLQALTLVRPVRAARIWARDPARAAAAAAELSTKLAIPVQALPQAAEACAGADIIVTTTPAEQPILMADWLEPGQHVTAMGSDSEHKNEIEPAAFNRAIYVADSLAQTRRLGELAHAMRVMPHLAQKTFSELGQVIAGLRPGRLSKGEITLCDLTGTGVQDTAIANLAFRHANQRGAGLAFDTKTSSGTEQ